MTAFEDFVNLELPQRAVMLTFASTGYAGDPRLSVAPKINLAPIGTWFIDDNTEDVWQKSGPTASEWELKFRRNQQGNLALIDAVNAGLLLYCNSATGDDIAGDGLTPGTAFATLERAIREIPNDPAVTGSAFVYIYLAGAGPYYPPRSIHLNRVSALNFGILGDVTTEDEALTVPSWSLVAGKHATYEASVGVYSTAPTDESHVLTQVFSFGGDFPVSPQTVDGTGSNPGGGTIRVVSSGFSPTGSLRLAPLTTVLGDNAGSFLELQNSAPGVSMIVRCCKLSPTVVARVYGSSQISFEGCVCDKSVQVSGATVYRGVTKGQLQVYGLERRIASFDSSVSGLVISGTTPGQLYLARGDAAIGSLLIRGSVSPQAEIHPAEANGGGAVEFDGIDFEPTAVVDGMRISPGVKAVCNAGFSMSSNIQKALEVNGSQLDLEGATVDGEMKEAMTVNDGAQVLGLKAACDGNIANTVVAGEDVIVGGDPTVHAFADLPKTDLAMGDASQICRGS